jgi:pSer/pThr/pTyr-binding forkhead associated (FHA) protein
MQVVLAMFRADGERRSFSISRDMTVIGRREDCDFRIPLGEISRKHCRLIKDGQTLRLEDLGSSNGTFRNGERIQEAELQPGDTIQVGPVIFVVQIDGVPADDQLQPMATAGSAAVLMDSAAAQAVTDPGDFDPMAVLDDVQDSGIMPALEDADSNAAAVDDDVVDMDLEESEHDQRV